MTPLLGAARGNANMTVFILDNATVAMTGAQESMASGERLIDILHGLGVNPDHLHVIEPLPRMHAGNVDLIRARDRAPRPERDRRRREPASTSGASSTRSQPSPRSRREKP